MTNDSSNELVLALGGAFNPLHTQHIESMNIAKKYLEFIGYKVIEGYLVPSTQSYVKNKLKNEESDGILLKEHHRINMCNLAADEENSWLRKVSKCYGSAYECIKKSKYQKVIVVGTDRAINKRDQLKWANNAKNLDTLIVIINRGGYNEKVMSIKNQLNNYDENNLPNPKRIHFVDAEETDNVSSTKVREYLKDLNKMRNFNDECLEIIKNLIDKKFLTQKAANYILSNIYDLFA